MSVSLIRHKRIKTTVAKAKALRVYVEPLITKSKNDTTHSRRVVFAHLKDKNAVNELFRDISVKVADRPGGYTRILKTGTRLGDNAEMCIIELVDYNTTYTSDSKAAKPATRRTRRGKSKSEATKTVSADANEKMIDTDTVAEETASKKVEGKVDEPAVETPKEDKPKEDKPKDKGETPEKEA
jgi:large subunit ribosomal protein L17